VLGRWIAPVRRRVVVKFRVVRRGVTHVQSRVLCVDCLAKYVGRKLVVGEELVGVRLVVDAEARLGGAANLVAVDDAVWADRRDRVNEKRRKWREEHPESDGVAWGVARRRWLAGEKTRAAVAEIDAAHAHVPLDTGAMPPKILARKEAA